VADDGAAVHLPQAELSPARLDALARGWLAEPARLAALAARAAARGRPDAAERIARRVLDAVGRPAR